MTELRLSSVFLVPFIFVPRVFSTLFCAYTDKYPSNHTEWAAQLLTTNTWVSSVAHVESEDEQDWPGQFLF